MHRVRESWTDERLDDFRDEVNRRFDKVDMEFRDLRLEMNGRFDSLQRTVLQIAGGTIAALLAGFAGVIITQMCPLRLTAVRRR
jgi:hypothetical protein